jgi:catechol 2,3-dioxygenase-like lactoylglutathione lyase family enzyme
MSPIKHLDHLNLTVNNLDQSEQWYAALFGFERVEAGVWHETQWRILRAGDAMLCMYEHPELTAPPVLVGRRAPQQHHLVKHFALRLHDEADFLARVEATGATLGYGGRVDWPHSSAWYVKDPSGYEIEVVRWHDDAARFTPAA